MRFRWHAFLANTLLYSAFLWLLIPGPFALRRLIRRRRGLCTACGYPCGEAAMCAECGQEVPKRSSAANVFDERALERWRASA